MSAVAGWKKVVNAKVLGLLAQFAVSALVLRLVLADVKLDLAVSTLRRLPGGFLLLAFSVLLGMQVFMVLRWWMVMRAVGSPPAFLEALKITLVGFLFNNVVPGLMGQDAARVYYGGRGVSYVNAGASVLFDKVLGLLVMVSFSGLAAAFMTVGASVPLGLPVGGDLEAMRILNHASMVCLIAAVAMVAGLGLLFLPVERLLRPKRMARPWLARLAGGGVGLALGLRACVRLSVLGAGFLCGLASYGALSLVYLQYFALTAPGHEAGLPGYFTVFAAVALITTLTNLPISFNGIGIREHSHMVFLTALGMGKEAAVGIALIQYAALVALSVLGLVAWLCIQRPQAEKADGHS